MKILLLLFAIFVVALSSCKTCTDCTQPGYPTAKLCKKDFPIAGTTYDEAVARAKQAGATCK
ncbi:MAG: hypothetical protein U0T73_05910 [Chitinophagales bacterium]